MARSAVGSEMVLPRLDVVLGLTARAVEPLVEVLGAAAFQAGDDKPGIGALEPGLDAGDDALDPAPALRGIMELPEAPHLAALGRRLEARGGALLQRCDMTAECGVGGQAEDPIHPVLPAPVEHFRGRIMTVGAQQDLDLWPMAAQGADQAAHKAADLHPARPLAGPQQRGDKAALCVEHNDRLEAVIVVIGVEQAQLLAAMHAIEASSMSRTMRLGTARNEPQYCSTSARPRRSNARRSGRFSSREIVDCEHSSSPAGKRSSASLNIGSRRSASASLPSSYPAAIISMRNRMISAKRCTTLSGARGSTRQLASRSAKPSRRSISRSASKPPSDDTRPPSKRATPALP